MKKEIKREDLPKEIQLILNGHNGAIEKATKLLVNPLSKLVGECQGKEGEELAGIMNFYWIEIVDIIRKAGAIGYYEGNERIK